MPADRNGIAYRVEQARAAHERGWSLCRLNGKVPIDKGWQDAPRAGLEQTVAWAREGNLGLRTGRVSEIAVVDDDTEDGSGVAELGLPPTPTMVTGSGKRHYYFRSPKGGLRNSVGKLAPKVDVRGDGGQVVFAGSVHPDTGQPYRWAPGLSPDEIELAELPEHVLARLQPPEPAPRPVPAPSKGDPRGGAARKATDVLADAAAQVARATEGGRNDVLNKQAYRLGRWVGAGLLGRQVVEFELAGAAKTCGLGDSEAAATIKSGLEAGAADPLERRHGDVATGEGSSPGRRAVPRPVIVVEGGLLPEIVDQAENALLKDGGDTVYQRGTLLVRAVRAPALTMRDIYRRAVGILMLCMVEAAYLAERLTQAARWLRPSGDGLIEIDCPAKVARTYIARKGLWRVPRLLGVIEAPTLRPDGSILDKPGYDPETCLFFDPGATEFPELLTEPSEDDALRALAVLRAILKDFPWLAASDRSAALAAILTALVRPSLRAAPLTAFRAPKMASGKSLLADVVAMIATGRVASVMSQGKDEDEDKKRMLAILIEGIQVACIDNIERPLGGAALCSVLTQETWRERILGKTGTATVPTATTWLATGNNLAFVGDITTRVVVCDLDPRCERPEERKFDVDLHEYVPAHRGELVAAALTILRAYHVAGRPDQKLSVFGRFEQWSSWVRSALVWLGEEDPCAGRQRIEDTDPVRRQLRMLLLAWNREIGSSNVTVAEVILRATPGTEAAPGTLWQALLEVATGKGGKPDGRRLGNYLSKYERRPEAGLRIERVGDRQGVALWRVAPVPDPATMEEARAEGYAGFEGSSGSIENGSEAGEGPNGLQGAETKNNRRPKSLETRTTLGADSEGRDPETHETHAPRGNKEAVSRTPAGPGSCRACSGGRWWRLSARHPWVCARCHPPADAAAVEWRGEEAHNG